MKLNLINYAVASDGGSIALSFSADGNYVSEFEDGLPADINDQTAVTHWTGEQMDAMFNPNPRH